MKTETPNETRYTHDFPSHYRKVITELERENAELREENLKLRKVIHDQGDEIRTLHIFNAVGAAIDAARAKEAQP